MWCLRQRLWLLNLKCLLKLDDSLLCVVDPRITPIVRRHELRVSEEGLPVAVALWLLQQFADLLVEFPHLRHVSIHKLLINLKIVVFLLELGTVLPN